MKTNYQIIKEMTDIELSDFLDRIINDERDDTLVIGCSRCCYYGTHHYPNDCKNQDGSICENIDGIFGWLSKSTLNIK